MFFPQTQVKVISNSTTFYPIDIRNEEGLTLINSIAFLEENFKEEIYSFKTEDQLVVLQLWNGLLFSISTKENYTEELLRFLLQVIRDIAIFLLGPHFENMMAKSIITSLREIYSRYVDRFFELCNKNYLALLALPDYEYYYMKFSQNIKELIKNDLLNIDESFVEGFIFKNHRIVSRISKNDLKILEPTDIFLISLFEQLEFNQINDLDNQITILENSNSIIHKGAYINFEGIPTQIVLSSVRFGQNSPYVMIIVSKVNQLSNEIKEKRLSFFIQISNILFSNPFLNQTFNGNQITGLIHYLLINRNTGDCLQSINPSINVDEKDEKWIKLLEKIKRKMISIGINSYVNGSPVVIRNEMIFQYTYDIILINSKKQKEIPIKNLNNTIFNENGISYKNLIGDDNDIICYELMTIYLGVINTSDVIKANSHLFKVLTDIKRKID